MKEESKMETFRPSKEAPPPTDGVALLRSIFDPLESGESDDFQAFYDAPRRRRRAQSGQARAA
jgi:hypothetical protein